MRIQRTLLSTVGLLITLLTASIIRAQDSAPASTYRLYEGLTAYVNNPDGKPFSVHLEVRDINLMSQGPREVLFKVYDPDGQPVVREIIPDDGITSGGFGERVGGFFQEMQYYATLSARGDKPAVRWSLWSDPARLKAINAQTFDRPIAGGKKGVYRIVLAGTSDHFVTLRLSPDLKHGVAGHPTGLWARADMLKKRYVYIPKDSTGVFFFIVEPDPPQTRTVKITAPDGKILFEGRATGGYNRAGGKANDPTTIKFDKPAEYEGKLLTVEVSEGAGDYLLRVTLVQPKEGAFKDYVGMGSHGVLFEDQATAMAIQGGTFVEDGLLFWHPFQARLHRWLKANPLDANDEQKALRKDLEAVFDGFRLLETSDGRGSAVWTHWSYSMGYYGMKIWRKCWLLMARPDVPAELKAIIREGLLMAGDRLSFAATSEAGNGNAFSQIPVGLWYCHRASGDKLQMDRFEIFWDRWKNQGWGPGLGLSKSGDSQESFAHDAHYGSYIMDNWKATGNTWITEGGILGDAKDDARFQQVMDRYYELYTYLYCREQDKRPVHAHPWSSRTHQHPHKEDTNWETPARPWKGEPGPDLTASVNGANEWFAARRKGYYFLTFHGRITPAWHSQCFPGQVGFGGGTICQLTVPGKGPVLVSTLTGSYGTGMHPSNWRNMRLHALVGETWDGRPLISSISEHDDARLEGNTVTSSGEVRDSHVKVSRTFTYAPDQIDCTVQLAPSDYAELLSIWSWERNWSEVKLAYEQFAYLPKDPSGKNDTTVTLLDAAGATIGPATTTPAPAQRIRIDRGGFGVEIRLEKPMKVLLGANCTVMVQIVEEGPKPTAAKDVALKYSLVPFGN